MLVHPTARSCGPRAAPAALTAAAACVGGGWSPGLWSLARSAGPAARVRCVTGAAPRRDAPSRRPALACAHVRRRQVHLWHPIPGTLVASSGPPGGGSHAPEPRYPVRHTTCPSVRRWAWATPPAGRGRAARVGCAYKRHQSRTWSARRSHLAVPRRRAEKPVRLVTNRWCLQVRAQHMPRWRRICGGGAGKSTAARLVGADALQHAFGPHAAALTRLGAAVAQVQPPWRAGWGCRRSRGVHARSQQHNPPLMTLGPSRPQARGPQALAATSAQITARARPLPECHRAPAASLTRAARSSVLQRYASELTPT